MKSLVLALLLPLFFAFFGNSAFACDKSAHGASVSATTEAKVCPMSGKTVANTQCTKAQQAACAHSAKMHAQNDVNFVQTNHHNETKSGASCAMGGGCCNSKVFGGVALAFALIFGFVTLFSKIKL